MRGRERTALVAASMMAVAVLMAPLPAGAADEPEGAVHDLLDAIEMERLDDLEGLVCEEWQGAIRDRFDVMAGVPADVDPGAAAGAVDLFITERTVELIEQAGERAQVRVGGQLRAVVDGELVRELAELSLGAFAADVRPEQIDEIVQQLSEQLALGSPIADDVTLTREGSAWLVCDDIAVGQEATAQGGSEEGMCAYMTVAELNVIDEEHGGAGFGSYARVSWDEETALCTYDEGEGGIFSVKTGRFQTPFDDVLEALGRGTDEMVDDRRARLTGMDLFVELGDGFLYVTAPAKSTPEGEIDYLTMPAGVAELVLSRIDG